MALAVVLDANVLYPIGLTDFFLTPAGYGLYRPHWSPAILAEVGRNLLHDYPHITAAHLEYRFDQMNRSCPGASVEPPSDLTSAMTNHEKDRHVLAVAVVSRSSVIATFNTADFPARACQPYGIEAQHPDALADYLVSLDPAAAARALQEMSDRTTRPHRTVDDVIERLERDLPAAMGRLVPVLRPR